MSLKPKTTREVYALLGGTKDPNGQRKWVSLEEAQKLEAEIKQTEDILAEKRKTLRECQKQLGEEQKRIVDALKILDEFIKSEPIGTIQKEDLERLRVCLKGVG